MTFFRKKRVAGREYVYEVENTRGKDGKTRQRVIRYVGPTDPIHRDLARVGYEDLKASQAKRVRRRRAVPKV